MNQQDIGFSRKILVAVAVSLFGAVTPALRAIGVNWDKRHIEAVILYDGSLSEDIAHIAGAVQQGLDAAFGNERAVTSRIIRCDYPKELVRDFRIWAFHRREKR